MSQLVQLRQKIRSIQTTKKITHAMRLISMSFYGKLDKLNRPFAHYTNNVSSLFLEALSYKSDWKNELLFPSDSLDSRPLYIVIATSKGLCGGLNSNLFRFIESSHSVASHQIPSFIAIGLKAINYVKEKDLGEMISCYADLNTNNFIALADDVVNRIIEGPHRYSSVTFYSSTAKSFFTQTPSKSLIIPVAHDALSQGRTDATDGSDLIWEQDQDQILEYLSLCYLRSMIVHLIFEALRAEHAARFLAMENSTNNAEKYLDRLTLQFNKLRQSLITREVSELSASFPVR